MEMTLWTTVSMPWIKLMLYRKCQQQKVKERKWERRCQQRHARIEKGNERVIEAPPAPLQEGQA